MNAFLSVALIIEGVMGLGLLFVPTTILAPLGILLNPSATPVARLFGSTLISLALLAGFALRSTQPHFRRAAAGTLFAYYAISAVIFVIAQLAGQTTSLGWVAIATHAALALWSGYFIINK